MTGHTPQTRKVMRSAMKQNDDQYHHPEEKIAQLERHLDDLAINAKILEVFAGQGNLTEYYSTIGWVTPMSKEQTGNSFDAIYKLRGQRKKYDLIDIDSYGYPDKFFPVVFEMLNDDAYLVFTFPIVGVNALNGITEQHYMTYWHSDRPSIGDVTGVLTDMAMREWMLLSLVDVVKIKRIWRFIYKVKRVKATEMTNVRNRA